MRDLGASGGETLKCDTGELAEVLSVCGLRCSCPGEVAPGPRSPGRWPGARTPLSPAGAGRARGLHGPACPAARINGADLNNL